ncbi:MAG: methyltransferase domain-containing protein [Panacagrimonas sp.]
MRPVFVERVLREMLESGQLRLDDRILAVCSDSAERDLFLSIGFREVTISNLDPRLSEDHCKPYRASCQNAMSLTFEDRAFDFAFVSDGLHHCSSPHRALVEMYRVAGKGVIVIESRDSLLMRAAVALGLSQEYEVSAVQYNNSELGGVDNSEIPNFIYRWTEREFVKSIRANHPVGRHRFHFVYGFNVPGFSMRSDRVAKAVKLGLNLMAGVLSLIARRQGNAFAMIALRPTVPADLWPWLSLENGKVRMRKPSSPGPGQPPR